MVGRRAQRRPPAPTAEREVPEKSQAKLAPSFAALHRLHRLQRSAGNAAVASALARGRQAHPEQQADNRPIVQRDVGLEFEVQGTHLSRTGIASTSADSNSADSNSADSNSADSTSADSTSAETPAPDPTLVPYGEKVLEGTGFHIESDTGRLEVVTKPFAETEEGRDALLVAVRQAAGLLLGGAALKKPCITVAELANAGPGAARVVDPTVIVHKTPIGGFPEPRGLKAKPQASVGIRLEQLPALVAAMADREYTQREGGKQHEEEAFDAEQDWAQVAGAVSSRTRDWSHDSEIEKCSPPLLEFIALLARHLYEAYTPGDMPLVYPKQNHAVMPRTNFAVTAGRLAQDIENTGQTVASLIKSITSISYREPAENLYTNGYYADAIPDHLTERLVMVARGRLDQEEADTVNREATKYWQQGPTVADFLKSVFAAVPALEPAPEKESMEGRTAPSLPGTSTERGMGTLMKEDSLPGGAAPVFELRVFEDLYAPEDWPDLADLVFGVTQRINRTVIEPANQTR